MNFYVSKYRSTYLSTGAKAGCNSQVRRPRVHEENRPEEKRNAAEEPKNSVVSGVTCISYSKCRYESVSQNFLDAASWTEKRLALGDAGTGRLAQHKGVKYGMEACACTSVSVSTGIQARCSRALWNLAE